MQALLCSTTCFIKPTGGSLDASQLLLNIISHYHLVLQIHIAGYFTSCSRFWYFIAFHYLSVTLLLLLCDCYCEYCELMQQLLGLRLQSN